MVKFDEACEEYEEVAELAEEVSQVLLDELALSLGHLAAGIDLSLEVCTSH